MPRRRRDEAVEERAGQILAESASGGQRRRRGAQQGAQTRRERRAAQAQGQAPPERGTRRNVARQERQRVHRDLLTIAFRGPLANRFRELADQHHLSPAGLLQDAVLSWESSVAAGYEPGTGLGQWKAQQGQEAEHGRSSLRRIQWKNALSGNTTMQIWLGKQYLGQQDRRLMETVAHEMKEWERKLEEAPDEVLQWLARMGAEEAAEG